VIGLVNPEHSRFVMLPESTALPTPNQSAALDGLARIQIQDADIFVDACEAAKGRSYVHYFPFLYFYGSDGRLRWERYKGSILIYQVRRQPTGGKHMTLYLPPMPFAPEALQHASDRIRAFNASKMVRIIWVGEEEVLTVARAGFSIFFKIDEFIHDRAAVMKLEGPSFRSLRQDISRVRRIENLETRPYRNEDKAACRAVLENWEKRLSAKAIKLTVGTYATKACLAEASRFSHPLLGGLVAEIEGPVRGFAFAGRICEEMGCIYLCYTDIRFRGLPQLLRYQLMEAHPDLLYFNSSGDSGREGLHNFKMQFRPIEMHGRFGAQMN
jgi:hypothetical protein